MAKSLSPIQLVFLLCAACLLSYYILFLGGIAEGTILEHGWAVPAAPFAALSVLMFLLLSGFWIIYSKLTAGVFSLGRREALRRNLWTYLPLVFVLLVPAADAHYFGADDLSQRVGFLGIGIAAAFIYLNAANWSIWSSQRSRPFPRFVERFTALPLKKRLILLFAVSFLLYNAGSAVLLVGGITLSGDEPHYLVISQSLLEDGDVDLSNNYAGMDYRKYMPPTTRLAPHVAPRTAGRFSFHSPGLAVVLFPFYALGDLFGGKLQLFIIRMGLSLFGVLLGLQIYLFARREWEEREKLALGLWAVFSFTTPVFFFSLHIYPEILIALFSLYIYRRLRFSESFSRAALLFMGFLLSIFIWLHAVKYIFILIPLFLYACWELLKRHKIGWNILYLLVFPVALTALHLLYSQSLYGSLSIFSVSLKGATTSSESAAYMRTILQDFPLRARLETLAGYFFDQRDGLLLYAPVYVFSFLGMIEMLRRRRRDLLVLLFLAAPYVLFHAFLTQRTSYAPQARTLVAVFWVMAVFLGCFLARSAARLWRWAYGTAVFLSAAAVCFLLRSPWSLYQPTTAGEAEHAGQLFASVSNLYFYLPSFLPSYLKSYDSHWLPNYMWLAALVLVVAVYALMTRRSGARQNEAAERAAMTSGDASAASNDTSPGYKDTRVVSDDTSTASRFSKHLVFCLVCLALFSLWIVLFPRTTLLYPVNAAFESGHKVAFYSLGGVARMTAPGRFRIPADKREYVFHFTSWRKIERLDLEFGSEVGDYFVKIRQFDSEVYQGTTRGGIETYSVPEPVFYGYRSAYLYKIGIYLERRSAVSITEYPFTFAIIPK